ncbi:Uncharacterised protein [Salmonella enterica subsp. arizonae]|uniref:Uncharacterized protein n=1 Tax=Salmonella enterica subsp. arizonae TaxID=59203 RepID=A0A379T1F9_SALER|nr:Uncharacterised protein [Salmonella enterica subsp. arizonae]
MSEVTQTLIDDAQAHSQAKAASPPAIYAAFSGAPLRCKDRGTMNASSIWAMPSLCRQR